LRVFVPFKGRLLKVDDFEPGEPVLHDSEGWRIRRMDRYRRGMGLGILIFLPLWPLLFFALNAAPWGAHLDWVFFIFYPLSYFGFMHILVLYNDWRDRGAGTVSGLYENGLLFRLIPYGPLYFIPYQDIERVETKGSRPLTRRKLLHLKGHEKPLGFGDLKAFLGEDGMAYLHRAMAGRVQHVGPPELRVYGPGGTHAQRPRREREHDDVAVYGMAPPFQD